MIGKSAKKDADSILNSLRTKKSDFWFRERESRPLKLFHEAARHVPAYKDFLKKHRVNPEKIKTFKDFELLPTTDKKSYLREYPLEKLSWDGTLKTPLVFTSTSGSTGEPYYFPRGEKLDWQASIVHEQFFRQRPKTENKPTLVIVCFGMGVWIGGLLTYESFEMISRIGNLPISIITPGINKIEIFKALKYLSPHYYQTILCGYPPFIKDIVDEIPSQSINSRKLNLRIITAAEAYTEKFRDYICKKGSISSPLLDTMNIYGTADIGAMAYETPTSILIRRLAIKNQKLFKDIFSDIHKTPTLAQYNPLFITFEAQGEDILLTGDNTIPLIRYAVGDHGGVMSLDEINQKLKDNGIDLKREVIKADASKYLSETPFVYVYERKDLSTTLYGLQIYPEIIREVLLDEPHNEHLTGKFSMLTKFDRKHNQYLEVNLELKKDKKHNPRLQKHLLNTIVLNLRKKISEFRELHDYLKHRAHPILVFWPHEHPKHFKPGIKQKWVKK